MVFHIGTARGGRGEGQGRGRFITFRGLEVYFHCDLPVIRLLIEQVSTRPRLGHYLHNGGAVINERTPDHGGGYDVAEVQDQNITQGPGDACPRGE